MNEIDLTTTDGLIAHLRTLPDANLENISRRPVWNEDSAVMALAARTILDARALGVR